MGTCDDSKQIKYLTSSLSFINSNQNFMTPIQLIAMSIKLNKYLQIMDNDLMENDH